MIVTFALPRHHGLVQKCPRGYLEIDVVELHKGAVDMDCEMFVSPR
jgi:hypothetical protein